MVRGFGWGFWVDMVVGSEENGEGAGCICVVECSFQFQATESFRLTMLKAVACSDIVCGGCSCLGKLFFAL